MHTTKIVTDQIDNHEILGLLFRGLELFFSHSASRGGSFLDGTLDGPELAGAFSRP
jgi:hypothetical protein